MNEALNWSMEIFFFSFLSSLIWFGRKKENNVGVFLTYWIAPTYKSPMYLLMYITKRSKWNCLASCGIMAIYFIGIWVNVQCELLIYRPHALMVASLRVDLFIETQANTRMNVVSLLLLYYIQWQGHRSITVQWKGNAVYRGG